MKRVASLLAAVAMLLTSAASLGSVWWIADEPAASDIFND